MASSLANRIGVIHFSNISQPPRLPPRKWVGWLPWASVMTCSRSPTGTFEEPQV